MTVPYGIYDFYSYGVTPVELSIGDGAMAAIHCRGLLGESLVCTTPA